MILCKKESKQNEIIIKGDCQIYGFYLILFPSWYSYLTDDEHRGSRYSSIVFM